jgi:hypothetical protein
VQKSTSLFLSLVLSLCVCMLRDDIVHFIIP